MPEQEPQITNIIFLHQLKCTSLPKNMALGSVWEAVTIPVRKWSAQVLTVSRTCLCSCAVESPLQEGSSDSSTLVESLRLNDRFAAKQPQCKERLHHTEAESTDWLVATGCPSRANSAVWAKEIDSGAPNGGQVALLLDQPNVKASSRH